MTSIEIRVRDLYDDLNDSEKKAASFFLSHVDSVFVLPIAKLAKQADTTQVAWVRLCKHIGFDGLKDMKKESLPNSRAVRNRELPLREHW